jgi:hypothetical protein
MKTDPNVEFDVLVRDGLDVEADCWDGGDGLVQLELVEDSWWPPPLVSYLEHSQQSRTGLARRVETQHEDAHLLVAKDFACHTTVSAFPIPFVRQYEPSSFETLPPMAADFGRVW